MASNILARASTRTPAVMLLLVLVFVGTRAYTASTAVSWPPSSDVEAAYRPWAVDIIDRGSTAYSETRIEYPPGSVPFVLAPRAVGFDKAAYRAGFITAMVLVDAIGLAGLLLLARRSGSMLGPWLWVVVLPILGALVYLRLDLVPAVATLWAVERADKNRWLGAGALLGFAVVAKAYAVVLLPIAFFLCPKETRKKFIAAAALLVVVFCLPFVTVLPDVFRSVIGYHAKRGVQIESLWGSMLFIIRSGEYFRGIFHNFGAHHFMGGYVWVFKALATIATACVVAFTAWIAKRSPKLPKEFADAALATILATVAVASVFSPQFLIWVIALGAAAICYPDTRMSVQSLMLVPIALLTRLVFPELHHELVRAEAIAVIVLWCRNIVVVYTAVTALVHLKEAVSGLSTPAIASAGTR